MWLPRDSIVVDSVSCHPDAVHIDKDAVHPKPGLPRMPENKNLTTTQESALAVYRKLTDRLGEPPSVRVFAEALGKSHSAAHAFIQQFRKKGYLSMRPITLIRPRLTTKARKAK
jgi:hypothetical protein